MLFLCFRDRLLSDLAGARAEIAELRGTVDKLQQQQRCGGAAMVHFGLGPLATVVHQTNGCTRSCGLLVYHWHPSQSRVTIFNLLATGSVFSHFRSAKEMIKKMASEKAALSRQLSSATAKLTDLEQEKERYI